MLFLVLICFSFFSGTKEFGIVQEPYISRTPQSLNSFKEGDYALINGTQGCPHTIHLQFECAGLSLKPLHSSGAAETQYFCNMNDQSKTQTPTDSLKGKITISKVTKEGDIIYRSLHSIYRAKTQELKVKTEDTLFFDQSGRLLWEHSVDGQGYSCLFSI
jgi:hypothetical protein